MLEVIITRKSSCVNARGIPTAAYQVLHLLSCTRWGYPSRSGPMGGGYLSCRTPSCGTPLARSDGGTRGEVPLCQGTPARSDGGVPEVGFTPIRVPHGQVRQGGTWGGVPPIGAPPGWLDLAGVHPHTQVWTDKQSETITFPLVLRTRSVIKSACKSTPLCTDKCQGIHLWETSMFTRT